MDRRLFLKSAGVLLGAASAPAVLAACGESGGIPDGEQQLVAEITTYEFLTGPKRPVPILVRTLDNVQVEGGELEVYVRTPDGEILSGPLPTTYQEAPGTGFGLHVAEFGVETPGTIEVVVVDGDKYGVKALNAVAPEQAEVIAPGDKAVSVETPTTSDDLGYDQMCTQDPPCGMHEVSLDTALAEGRPTVVIFATPEFCQTVTCGPAVSTVDQIRTGGDWGDTAWIHVEVFSETKGDNLKTGKAIRKWELPSEPWLFTIDGTGKIAGRVDGPMLADRVTQLVTEVTA